jgi:predicted Zn-dependent peptidase
MHVGASTTPDRCDETLATLLREVDRLADDLEPEEVDRAIVGIVARSQTRGEITQAHVTELGDDLFYYGRPVPLEEKLRDIQGVTVSRIRDYLDRHRRDRLSLVTLGPRGPAQAG